MTFTNFLCLCDQHVTVQHLHIVAVHNLTVSRMLHLIIIKNKMA